MAPMFSNRFPTFQRQPASLPGHTLLQWDPLSASEEIYHHYGKRWFDFLLAALLRGTLSACTPLYLPPDPERIEPTARLDVRATGSSEEGRPAVEAQSLVDRGATPVYLGKRILRAETAPIALLSAILLPEAR